MNGEQGRLRIDQAVTIDRYARGAWMDGDDQAGQRASGEGRGTIQCDAIAKLPNEAVGWHQGHSRRIGDEWITADAQKRKCGHPDGRTDGRTN